MAKQSNKKNKNKTVLVSVIIAAVLVIACVSVVISNNIKDSSKTGVTDTNKNYFADINIKDYGTVTVELDEEAAPITV